MPRDLPIGNDNLLVNFDLDYNLRDIYYPHIGQENHAEGCVSRTGVWADGVFAWIGDRAWHKRMDYERDSLVTRVTATNPEMDLTLVFWDVVDFQEDVFIRRVQITNNKDLPRVLRLFFHYQLSILGRDVGDTIYYHPELKGLLMYKDQRYFLATGQVEGRQGLDDWTTWGTRGRREGNGWQDAEDGVLAKIPLSFGLAEGIIGLEAAVPEQGQATVYHWLAAGDRFHGIELLNNRVRQYGPESFVERTRNYWRVWANKETPAFADLPQSLPNLYRRSLLTMRLHTDNHGAIIAGTDSDIVEVLGDTYAYMWGRDGALVVQAFDLANYDEISHWFFDFCSRAITSGGYLLHKYNADGSAAGMWIPWLDDQGRPQLPIEEDETALVLRSLWHHYSRFREIEHIRLLYPRLIRTAAEFMFTFREPHTGLPLPSYDVWEERRGIHTFTAAAVWAGLEAAAKFAELFGDVQLSERWSKAAAEIRGATIRHLYDRQLGRFLRSVNIDADGNLKPDYTVDASICGVFLFGMLPADDPLVTSTMEVVRDRLVCKTEAGGVARYENDAYQKIDPGGEAIPGNPWIVCTMWLAQYYIARARSLEDLRPARQILAWTERCARQSGVLPEQVDPRTCNPLGVSPLAWSHASVVITVQEYINKYYQLVRAPR